MSHNLNVSNFRNGDPIPEARSNAEWIDSNSMNYITEITKEI